MRRAPWARRARHLCEGLAVALLFAVLRALPVRWASALGAAVAGALGPLLPVHRHGIDNIAQAFPAFSPAEVRRCARRMWRHLGRVAAEYPHLNRFSIDAPDGRLALVGRAHLAEARRSPRGGIFFSGHVGNWEVAALAPEQSGIPVALVYRPPNNPIVDRLIRQARDAVARHRIPKGAIGARDMVRTLKAGRHLALLVDQKFNGGIAVPFFGREAMTAPSVASLAVKYGCPVWPVRVERLAGTRFRITVFPALRIPREGSREEKVRTIMIEVNRMLEGWIRDRPEQWLWLHRRWPCAERS